jgi:O-antigen/teichoic acid export membrane protein
LPNLKINLIWVYVVNLVNGILGIVFVALGVKILGTDNYGLFSIYSVLAAYVGLADLGISKNLIRLLASRPSESERKKHLQSALGIYISLGTVLLLIIPVLILVIPHYFFPVSQDKISSLRWIVFFSIIEYIFAIPTVMVQNFCVANEHIDRYAKFNFISSLYRYGLMFAGVIIWRNPAVVVALVVSRRLIDLFVAPKIMGILPVYAWRPLFVLSEIKSMLGHSSALSMAQLFQSTVIAIGSFLTNRYFGLSGLGLYRAAFDLASKVWFISNGIGLVVFPRFANLLSTTAKRVFLFHRIPNVLNLSWVSYNVFFVVGVFIAPSVLDLMKLQHLQILTLLNLILLGVCQNAHANLSYELFQADGKYKVVALLSAITLLIMVGIFYAIYRTVGINAIGWSWAIGQSLSAIIFDAVIIALNVNSIKIQVNMFIFKIIIFISSLSTIMADYYVLPDFLHYLSIIILVTSLLITLIKVLLDLKEKEDNAYA